MATFKKGQKLTIKGEKLIVSSLNDDGTVTLNYASGSGKTGFAGKIVNPDSIKAATSPKAVFVESISPIEDSDAITLDQYNSGTFEEEKRVPSLMESFVLQNSLSDGGVADGAAIRALEAGIDRTKITNAVTRLVEGTFKEPNKDQVLRRLDFLAAEKDFEDKYSKVENHKFKMFTSAGDKRKFYKDSLTELTDSYNQLSLAHYRVTAAEQVEPWGFSKDRYSNSYRPEPGPKRLNIPETASMENIEEKFSEVSKSLRDKIVKLDANWL